MKARIIDVGKYVPNLSISNEDFTKIMDTNNEWIVQRTGISSRHFSEINTSEMAYQAVLNLLENTKFNKEDIEIIIVCTCTPDAYSPSVANLVKKKLKLSKDIPSFDINAACSGFIYGLKVVQGLIESGLYQNIILVGSENLSKLLNFDDRSTAVLFGDGAGAILVQGSNQGIIDTLIYNKDDINGAINIPNGINIETPFTNNQCSGPAHIQMKGQDVFKFATKVCINMLKEIVVKNNLTFNDIKCIIPHQANLRIIEYAIKMLGINKDKFVITLESLGNTSSASIPIALDSIKKELKKGDKLIFVAFGGGLTYGVSLLEW
ncbi:MAG: ketoacyl-ACP synthase III [Bacilli bacterium]|jgi:3-oxoacyl-[acyl-carrier-protein] synthase-3|nr:ketoacyl-ACP synthase III [Bacilli bacterium]